MTDVLMKPAGAPAVPSQGLTGLAAAFATDRTVAFPPEALAMAKLSIFDWFTVLHAGASEPVHGVVRALVEREQSQGSALAIGLAHGVSARAAAYLNGATSHALDYDDTHFGMGGHPTVGVFPAVLAMAQESGADGRALLEAFLIGAEVACRLGAYFGRAHYAAGFHPTATVGSFGATAGVSRLLGLSAEETRHALGFTSTRTSGLRSQFGTMGKPIHAGMASSNGVEAALLVSYGCVSRPDALECVEGFAATHVSADTEEGAGFHPGAPFQFTDVKFKFHACCHGTHGPLEAILCAKPQVANALDDIVAVRLTVNPQWRNICCIARPTTGLEVKFSLSTTLSMALLGVDTASPDSFTEALCVDPAIVALADKVVINFDAAVPDTLTNLTIERSTGEPVSVTYDLAAPTPYGIAAESLKRKASGLLGEARADRLWDFVQRLDGLNAQALSAEISAALR